MSPTGADVIFEELVEEEGGRKRELQHELSNQHQTKRFKLETTQVRRLSYPTLEPEQRLKLEEHFQHIISNAAIDFTKIEMKDIQAAMKTMLERIRTRVNRRGIFNISGVMPAGSMREQTSLWKFHYTLEGAYIEFDFLPQLNNLTHQCTKQTAEIECTVLAQLNNLIHQCTKQTAKNECKGCIKIVKPPVNLERVRQCYSDREDEFNANSLEKRKVISDLFLNEINYCLTTACNCLTFQFQIENAIFVNQTNYKISLRPSSKHHKQGCGECTVDMPTGTLHVNTEIDIELSSIGPNDCSLIFQWTSKAKSLSAPDSRFLQEPQPVSQLPIFVDFLPALESLTSSSSGAGEEHDLFIVPKGCNVCDRFADDYAYRWRKSWCIAELNAFTKEMSDKHRRCYQIIKYLSEIPNITYSFYKLPGYHIKTIVLRHHTERTDTTDALVQCILKIYQDLHQAYETKELLSYQSNVNLLVNPEYLPISFLSISQMSNLYSSEMKKCEKIINTLCSVSVTDTWETFIRKALS